MRKVAHQDLDLDRFEVVVDPGADPIDPDKRRSSISSSGSSTEYWRQRWWNMATGVSEP